MSNKQKHLAALRRTRLYPLTDARLTNMPHAAQVLELIGGGARFIQLREKHLSPLEFYEAARPALEVARRYGAALIINDRVDIALAIGADGVHLGQNDLPPDAARQVLGAQAIIGYSTHSVTQALAATAMPLDYLAIGPVFATQTKENPDAVVGLEGVRRVREALGADKLLVAIGGITLANAPQVLDAGADVVAVISALLSEPKCIAANTQTWVEQINAEARME